MGDFISVGCFDEVACIRVSGRGTCQNSVDVKVFVQRLMAKGMRQFVVDLAQCEAMDSTFMGTLTSIALRLIDHGGGQLDVINAGDRSRHLLEGLGLDELFVVHSDGGNFNFADDKALKPLPAEKKPSKKHILGAHEALIEAAEGNEEKFRDVVEFLKTEIGEAR